MRKSMAVFLVVIITLFLVVPGGSAATFYDHFPSNDSTVVASVPFIPPFYYGYFYPDTYGLIEETFINTGLQSVVGLKLTLFVYQDVGNVLTAPIVWQVFINDNYIDNWTQRPGDGFGPKTFNFVFPDIIGQGTYKISMNVLDSNPNVGGPGLGAIYLGFGSPPFPGPLLLVGCACPPPAPVPGTVWFLGSGLAVLLGLRQIRGH